MENRQVESIESRRWGWWGGTSKINRKAVPKRVGSKRALMCQNSVFGNKIQSVFDFWLTNSMVIIGTNTNPMWEWGTISYYLKTELSAIQNNWISIWSVSIYIKYQELESNWQRYLFIFTTCKSGSRISSPLKIRNWVNLDSRALSYYLFFCLCAYRKELDK